MSKKKAAPDVLSETQEEFVLQHPFCSHCGGFAATARFTAEVVVDLRKSYYEACWAEGGVNVHPIKQGYEGVDLALKGFPFVHIPSGETRPMRVRCEGAHEWETTMTSELVEVPSR